MVLRPTARLRVPAPRMVAGILLGGWASLPPQGALPEGHCIAKPLLLQGQTCLLVIYGFFSPFLCEKGTGTCFLP